MKKIVALILALVLVMGLSVTAFAEESPVGKEVVNLTIVNGIGANKSNATLNKNGTYTLNADTSKGTFNSWVVYKADGTVAKEGVDYKFTSGTAKDKDAVIQIISDQLTVCGNYDGKTTDPVTATEKTSTSPKTGDVAIIYLVLVMMAAAACGFVTKKQLAK